MTILLAWESPGACSFLTWNGAEGHALRRDPSVYFATSAWGAVVSREGSYVVEGSEASPGSSCRDRSRQSGTTYAGLAHSVPACTGTESHTHRDARNPVAVDAPVDAPLSRGAANVELQFPSIFLPVVSPSACASLASLRQLVPRLHAESWWGVSPSSSSLPTTQSCAFCCLKGQRGNTST